MAAIISHCSISLLEEAAQALKSGALVAFPTETVYGLGADAENESAIARMYQAKGRPSDHPVIVHIPDLDEVDYWAEDIPQYAIALMRDFWPGPMTLILKRSDKAKNFITGSQDYLGLRIPAHTVALNLLHSFKKIGGHGVAAPSANRFGALSPTSAEAVREELDKFLTDQDRILDGGPSLVGVESTIIDCSDSSAPRLLRPGAVTVEMIQESTGLEMHQGSTALRVSGGLRQHYSPRAKVLLDTPPLPGTGLIAHSSVKTPTGVIRLASPESDEEFARDLYQALRAADHQSLPSVSVYLPEGEGLAEAIRDRLTKSAAE
jgi:L-threonylcarbamoyladenylate synthase